MNVCSTTLGWSLLACALWAADPRPLAFSQLSIERQAAIERRLARAPVAERDAPYSTPMYYLLHKGFKDGIDGELFLESNRPDWQEELIRDWHELGLTSTHFVTTPGNWDNPHVVKAIRDYFALSVKYGLRVGIRLAGDTKIGGIEREGWDLHPGNPHNKIPAYVDWVKRVAEAGKGRVDYYVVGDEVNSSGWEERAGAGKTRGVTTATEKRWTPEVYMKVLPLITNAIRGVDPKAKTSMFGMNGLDWTYVQGLFRAGYAKYADGVAANIDFGRFPSDKLKEFVENVKAEAPGFSFFSNGVGYVGARDTTFNPTNHKYTVYSDKEQAIRIAKIMFKAFDAGWDSAPYYIAVRQWILPDGQRAPHWYGFFGFTDLVVDKFGKLTTRRYPGWYAYQTVAHVFDSKSKISAAPFNVSTDTVVSTMRTLVRNGYECLIVLWNESRETTPTTLTLPTQRFVYPRRISLYNYQMATDISYRFDQGGGLVLENVLVGTEPVLIRLVAEQPEFGDT
jgi:hypothetical protein